MDLSRLRAVLYREILEIRKNRSLLVTIFLPPLLLTILPLGLLGSLGEQMSRAPTSAGDISRYYSLSTEFASFTPGEVLQLIILQQFLLFFLLMPLIIPMSIAAFS